MTGATFCLFVVVGVICPAPEKTAPIDGFAQRYERIIRSPEDSASIKTLPRHLRDRIAGNDTQYLCATGWEDPICKGANDKNPWSK